MKKYVKKIEKVCEKECFDLIDLGTLKMEKNNQDVNVLTTNCLPGPFEELANVNSSESSYYSCEEIKS